MINKLYCRISDSWEGNGGEENNSQNKTISALVNRINKMAVDKFLNAHNVTDNASEFWVEQFRSTIIASIESIYRKEYLKDWGISDIVINGDKVLIKWYKRIMPLSDSEMIEKYGK